MLNLAILSSHNGSGFDAIHEAIQSNLLNINISLVISNNTDAKVLQKAERHGLKNFLINKKLYENPDEKIFEILENNKIDIIFLSGYMKKVSVKIIKRFKIINSHPALLPKYGGTGMYGRFVHEAVIKNSEKVSGVTIHEVDEIYDNGKIILQEEVLLLENETVESLESKIKALEKKAIVNGLRACLK